MDWKLGFLLLAALPLAGCSDEDEAGGPSVTPNHMHGSWSGFTMTAAYSDLYGSWQSASVDLDIVISPGDMDYYYDHGLNAGGEIIELTSDYIRFRVGTDFLECEGRRVGDVMVGECVPLTGQQFRNLWKLTRGTRE